MSGRRVEYGGIRDSKSGSHYYVKYGTIRKHHVNPVNQKNQITMCH